MEHLAESLSGSDAAAERSGVASVTTLREMEKRAITDVLRVAKGNHSKAARMLAISRNTLYRKIKELEIQVPGEDPSHPQA